MLAPSKEDQEKIVFDPIKFSDSIFPPLVGFWSVGLGLQGYRMALYQLEDRAKVGMMKYLFIRSYNQSSEYSKYDSKLIGLGFTANAHEGNINIFYYFYYFNYLSYREPFPLSSLKGD